MQASTFPLGSGFGGGHIPRRHVEGRSMPAPEQERSEATGMCLPARLARRYPRVLLEERTLHTTLVQRQGWERGESMKEGAGMKMC